MMKDLSFLEEIVKLNPELSWEGWDIVRLLEDQNAYMSTNGVFKNGKWYFKEVYKLKEDGWDIPKKIIKENNV